MARGTHQGLDPLGGEAAGFAATSALETWRGRDEGEGGPTASPRWVPTLTILYHPAIERVGAQAVLDDLVAGEPVLICRTSPAFSSRNQASAVPLADRNLSRGPLRLTANGSSLRLDLGDCRTHVAVDGEPLRGAVDLPAEAVKRGVVIELAGRVVLLLHVTSAVTATGVSFATLAEDLVGVDLLGESASMRRLRQDIRRVADLDIPVLVRGETGTGKELVARAIHRASPRRTGPFVAVSVAAIPSSLASSELFGAERGAFTGAVRRSPGYFAQAHGGTLFLDEIGETPPEIQVALLRALETGEIQAVGAQHAQKIDVRVLAATDADLEVKITEGSFRAPLLHRLAAYELWVPSLRQRRDDFGRLLLHFCEQELARIGETERLRSPPEKGELWLPASLVARLAQHDWPGNVRQLRNVARQLVIGNRGRSRVELVPSVERLMQGAPPGSTGGAPLQPPSPADAARASSPDLGRAPELGRAAHADGRRRPAEVSEEELEAALRASRWDLAAAAAMLRVSRSSLYAIIEESPRFRKAGDISTDEIARAHEACSGDVERMVELLEVSERALRRRLRELGLEERGPGDDARRMK